MTESDILALHLEIQEARAEVKRLLEIADECEKELKKEIQKREANK